MAGNRVEVTINSRQYVVLADEPIEYIEKLAAHIDEKVDMVMRGGQNVMGERPVILAALNICDEYFKCEEAGRVLQNQLKACSEKLNEARIKLNEFEGRAEQISFDEKEAEEKLAAAAERAETAEKKSAELEKQIAELKLKLEIAESKNTAGAAKGYANTGNAGNRNAYNNAYNNRNADNRGNINNRNTNNRNTSNEKRY